MQADRVRETERINDAFLEEVVPFAVHGATIVDARGMTKNGWLVSDGRSIVETGCAETDFETACRLVHVEQDHIVNANGMVMTPDTSTSTRTAHGEARSMTARRGSRPPEPDTWRTERRDRS